MADWTPQEEREIGGALSRNPFTKKLCEAMVLYQCTGSLDGFSDRAGDERWNVVAGKLREALSK